jgi:hypothetical protein
VPLDAPAGAAAVRADDEIGFALQGGVMFKLPMIAPSDELWLQAAYADGAIAYTGLPSASTFVRFTSVRTPITDAFVNAEGGVETTEAWSVSGKFLHYWLPNLRSNLFGGYAEVNFGSGASGLAAPIGGVGPDVRVGFPDVRLFELGANLIWSPVKNLDIGIEGVYRRIEVKGRVADPFAGGTFNEAGQFVPPASFVNRTTGSDDVFEARFRLQRDF